MILTTEINLFQDEPILKRFRSNETSLTVVQGKISALISESQIDELIDGGITMYTKLNNLTMTVDGIRQIVSEQLFVTNPETEEVTSRIHLLESTVSTLNSKIQSDYITKTNLDDVLGSYITLESFKSQIQQTDSEIYAAVSSTFVTGDQYNHRTSYGSTAPTNPTVGDLWVDTKSINDGMGTSAYVGYVLKRWNGTSWVTCRDGALNQLNTRVNSAELKITDSAIVSTVRSAGVNRTYRTASAPTSGMVEGDLWIDPSNNNLWRYSGYRWVKTQDSAISSLQTRMSTAETKITDSAIVSTVSSSAWGSGLSGKVSSVEAKLTSTAIIASINNANTGGSGAVKLTILDSRIVLDVYASYYYTTDKYRRLRIDENGVHFWRTERYVGKIGTNVLKTNANIRGFTFDLEYNASYNQYMAWAHKETENANVYTIKWAYATGYLDSNFTYKALHAGADIDMHNNRIYRPLWYNSSGGSAPDCTGSITVGGYTLTFNRGVLVNW